MAICSTLCQKEVLNYSYNTIYLYLAGKGAQEAKVKSADLLPMLSCMASQHQQGLLCASLDCSHCNKL